jgi:hypothetical protein
MGLIIAATVFGLIVVLSYYSAYEACVRAAYLTAACKGG